jgi:uncharacterized membrane protein YjjP (DUF1212 family)
MHYLLGIGISSISYSILALMKAERMLALPIAFFSVPIGYLVSAYLNASFFLVLFGTATTVSALVGWLTNKRRK